MYKALIWCDIFWKWPWSLDIQYMYIYVQRMIQFVQVIGLFWPLNALPQEIALNSELLKSSICHHGNPRESSSCEKIQTWQAQTYSHAFSLASVFFTLFFFLKNFFFLHPPLLTSDIFIRFPSSILLKKQLIVSPWGICLYCTKKKNQTLNHSS